MEDDEDLLETTDFKIEHDDSPLDTYLVTKISFYGEKIYN